MQTQSMAARFVGLHFAAIITTAVLAASIEAAESGFYRAEKQNGRWWLISPEGKQTILKGVCHVQFDGDRIKGTDRSPYRESVQAKYGDVTAWRETAAKRLSEWGFNTVGAWSDDRLTQFEVDGKRLACAPILDLGAQFVAKETRGGQAWLHGIFPDVFDPGFESFCRNRTLERCSPRKEEKTILGWFTDNELRWGPDWRGKEELLTLFLNRPANSPGRHAALEFLARRYPDIQQFNNVWKMQISAWAELEKATNIAQPFFRQPLYAQNEMEERAANEADPARAAFVADCEAFTGEVAERYFKTTRTALREADPNHLNLGCRFAYLPPAPVLEAAARHSDVISFNCYLVDPMPVVRKYAEFDRPLVIGEFTFRAQDSGLPNTRGAGPKVPDQKARAAAFKRYVQLILHEPTVVGYNWFQHNDQPKEGRFDGENSNYGVVDENDRPYPELTETMKSVNALAEVWHTESAKLVFRDDFAGKLGDGWQWLREDKSAWRITSDGLEIRIQPGNLWGNANNARNVLVRPIPQPNDKEVMISVTVRNHPTGQYEQANLAWYYDDAHMVKLGQELVDGRLCIVMGREENDRTRTIAIIPINAFAVELQLRAHHKTLHGRFRPTGTDEWQQAGECDLPIPTNGHPMASIHCYQGPPDAGRWVQFSSFRVESVEHPTTAN